jgi:release factor glutamine methyltransferase
VGVGIDSSGAALVWAERNAGALGVAPRCRFERANWTPAEAETFDVILSNPPYLTAAELERSDPEIRDWEPLAALVGGEDGLDAMRALAPVIRRHLRAAGKAFIEIGKGQEAAAAEILGSTGLDVQEGIPDLSGVPRCLVAGRAEGRGR